MAVLSEVESTKKYFVDGIPNIHEVAPHHFPNLRSKIFSSIDETKTTEYKFNSLGYRDNEFFGREDNSIWLLGHSDTVGVGVEEQHTYAGILRQYHDTLNLGVAGAGWDTVARIVTSGLKIHRPRAIIIIMSDWVQSRREVAQDNYFQLVTPNLPKEYLPYENFYRYIDESNSNYSFEKNINLILAATRRVETKIFDFPDRHEMVKRFPSADGTHIGKEVHNQIAEKIIKCLNLTN